jgi:hypothetical protein
MEDAGRRQHRMSPDQGRENDGATVGSPALPATAEKLHVVRPQNLHVSLLAARWRKAPRHDRLPPATQASAPWRDRVSSLPSIGEFSVSTCQWHSSRALARSPCSCFLCRCLPSRHPAQLFLPETEALQGWPSGGQRRENKPPLLFMPSHYLSSEANPGS